MPNVEYLFIALAALNMTLIWINVYSPNNFMTKFNLSVLIES